MRRCTQNWVTSEVVKRQLESRKQPENVEIDTRLSVISPFMLNGSPSFTIICKKNKQIVLNGWEKSGITKFLKIDAALNQTGVDLVTLPIIVWLGCRSTPYIDIIMFSFVVYRNLNVIYQELFVILEERKPLFHRF